MTDGEARRYCSVCGYLSSEPMVDCPQCSLASSRVPAPLPAPFDGGPTWAYDGRVVGPGPPAWAVLLVIVAIALIAVVLALVMDGLFNAPAMLGNGAAAATLTWRPWPPGAGPG